MHYFLFESLFEIIVNRTSMDVVDNHHHNHDDDMVYFYIANPLFIIIHLHIHIHIFLSQYIKICFQFII